MKLHYIEKGNGNITLVFLHYFGGAANTWNEVMNRLQNEFRCIAVDMLGFGKSPAINQTISVDNSTDTLIELLENLNLRNYILIGHSMGGKIAINAAAKDLKGLLRLILIAPSPPSAEPMTEQERNDMFTAFGNKEAVKKMIQNAVFNPLPEDVFLKEVNNNLQTSQAGWQSWPKLGSKEIIIDRMKDVHVPLSIFYGDKDKRFTMRFLENEYSRYFLTFALTEIKNSGHLIPAEAPEILADEIRKTAKENL